LVSSSPSAGSDTGMITYPQSLPGALRSSRPSDWTMSTTDSRGSAYSKPSTPGTSTPSLRQRADDTIRTWLSWFSPSQRRICARSPEACWPCVTLALM
jgi:hypothetical protein